MVKLASELRTASRPISTDQLEMGFVTNTNSWEVSQSNGKGKQPLPRAPHTPFRSGRNPGSVEDHANEAFPAKVWCPVTNMHPLRRSSLFQNLEHSRSGNAIDRFDGNHRLGPRNREDADNLDGVVVHTYAQYETHGLHRHSILAIS